MAIQTTSYLKKSALFRVGELTDGTSPYDSKCLEYINQIYRAILAGGNEFELELGSPWGWARSPKPGTFVLSPKYSSGSVAVVNGSTTITFSPAPSISLEGQWIKIVGRPETFRIDSHAALSATAVIDTPYTDETTSNLPFDVYFLEYDLPMKIERIIAPMVVQRQQEFTAPKDGLIYQVDMSNMDEIWPIKQLPEEIPQQYAVLSKDNDGDIRIRVNAQAGEQTRVSFDYIPVYSPLVEISVEQFYVSGTTDTIQTPDHGLLDGAEIVFSVSNVSSISVNKSYYVVNAQKDSFQISLTKGGAVYDISNSGDITFSSVPILPVTFRDILDYGAAFYLMVDKNDERSEAYGLLVKAKMKAMISANNRELSQASSGRIGEMIPRMDMYTGPRRYWRQEPSN
jgi:hypothetical protein